jgi:hypothetical protein
MVSPLTMGAGRLKAGGRVMAGMNGALSMGAIVCSAGYAPNDSVIVVYRSALTVGDY